jgi:hypothetical protein
MKPECVRREFECVLEREKCFGYQSPYAGEMFDIFSENDFFSVNRVITSSKLSPSNLSASNFVYTPSEIDRTFVLIFSTSYKIY